MVSWLLLTAHVLKRFQPEVSFAHTLLHQWFVEKKRVEDAACFLICQNKQGPSIVGTTCIDLISSLELIDHWTGGGPVATCCNCGPNPATFQKKQEWYTFDDSHFSYGNSWLLRNIDMFNILMSKKILIHFCLSRCTFVLGQFVRNLYFVSTKQKCW